MKSPITSDEILKQYEKTLEIALSPEGQAEAEKAENLVMARELEILNKKSICPPDELSKLQIRLPGLKPKKLKKATQKQFYNPDLMTTTSCITDSIVYTPPVQKGAVTPDQRIRHWISSLRQIGSESAFGIAMAGSLQDAQEMYIIKAPRDEEANQELIHELFVGLYGTNKLRSSIPNFAYIFGGFKCSPPIIDEETKEVITWCNVESHPVNFILYENINPSISFYDFAAKATATEFLQQYLQVLYALRKGQKEIGFTHYDLHGDNLLIREIDQGRNQDFGFDLDRNQNRNQDFFLRYETENGIEYLRTNRIATIIDYGRSIIRYNNRYFGVYTAIPYFVYPNLSFPLHDAYKLLLSSIQYMRAKKNPASKEIERIVPFFNSEESITEIINQQSSLAFSLPRNEKTKDLTLFDLTSYIRKIFKPDFILIKVPDHSRVLGCNGTDLCFDIKQSLEELNMDHFSIPTDLFEFFDLGTRFQSEEGGQQRFQILKSRFGYLPARDRELDSFFEKEKKIMILLSSLDPLTISGLNPDEIFSSQTLNRYRSYVTKIVKIYHLFEQMKTSKDTLLYAAEVYDDLPTLQSIKNTYNYLQNHYYTLQEKIDELDFENQLISSLINQERGERIEYLDGKRRMMDKWSYRVKENPSLKWYEKGLELFSYLAL